MPSEATNCTFCRSHLYTRLKTLQYVVKTGMERTGMHVNHQDVQYSTYSTVNHDRSTDNSKMTMR